jgi:hypothetical protein
MCLDTLVIIRFVDYCTAQCETDMGLTGPQNPTTILSLCVSEMDENHCFKTYLEIMLFRFLGSELKIPYSYFHHIIWSSFLGKFIVKKKS